MKKDSLGVKLEIDPLVIFHIGGGDEHIGPANNLMSISGLDIELYVFEIIEDEGYTTIPLSGKGSNVVATLVPYGIGGIDGQEVTFRVNKHRVSSSVLPGSKVTLQNNPNYPGISDWAENVELDFTFEARLRSIDSLVESGALPPPDFISMDIQGLELAAMQGATESLDRSVLGIFTESEFTEIYEGQGMFYEQLSFLEAKAFRLVGFESEQNWFFGPPIGKGFLTVAESFFLKHVINQGLPNIQSENTPKGTVDMATLTPEKLLKLALIAFSFERYSYFHYILSYLKDSHPSFFSSLSKGGFIEATEVFDKISKAWSGAKDGKSKGFSRSSDQILLSIDKRPIRRSILEILASSISILRSFLRIGKSLITRR